MNPRLIAPGDAPATLVADLDAAVALLAETGPTVDIVRARAIASALRSTSGTRSARARPCCT